MPATDHAQLSWRGIPYDQHEVSEVIQVFPQVQYKSQRIIYWAAV